MFLQDFVNIDAINVSWFAGYKHCGLLCYLHDTAVSHVPGLAAVVETAA
jgi:hypothetical protein